MPRRINIYFGPPRSLKRFLAGSISYQTQAEGDETLLQIYEIFDDANLDYDLDSGNVWVNLRQNQIRLFQRALAMLHAEVGFEFAIQN